MNNIAWLPTAKTYLHYYPKQPGPEVLELVYDKGLNRLTEEQKNLLNKRIRLEDEIMEALPIDKKKLFNDYMDLQLQDSVLSIDKAINWTIEHEAEIQEVMSL